MFALVAAIRSPHCSGVPSCSAAKRSPARGSCNWGTLVHEYMAETYELAATLGEAQVLTAVRVMKDKYREETLLQMARGIDWEAWDAPGSGEALQGKLEELGAYLEEEDADVLEDIVATGGRFARTKVPLPADHMELSDTGNIVVWMDSHQQKHQKTQIAQFPPYTAGKGTKFADGEGLAWHVANTVPVVRTLIATAISAGNVSPRSGVYHTPKVAQADRIVYDLGIDYGEATGKYVGTYHCNPVSNR
jgi:hypothetical protein